MMAQAWPHVSASQELVPWADDEFAMRVMDLTLFAHVEQTPDLRPDDPDLLAVLEPFGPIERAGLARHLALLSGHDERHWTLDDFAFRRREQHGWIDDDDDEDDAPDPAAQHLDDLTLTFLGALHRDHGVSLAKGDLARTAIGRYILKRHIGELEPIDSPFDPPQRPKGRAPRRAVPSSTRHRIRSVPTARRSTTSWQGCST